MSSTKMVWRREVEWEWLKVCAHKRVGLARWERASDKNGA